VPPFDLRQEAQDFADELTDLLNKTVTAGIRLVPITSREADWATVGLNLTRTNASSPGGIPLTLGKKPPSGYLGLLYRLAPDDVEQTHLMVVSSFTSICLDANLNETLLHYDYERNKHQVDGYPEAHVQVCANSDVWERFCASRSSLDEDSMFERLHLPVGGRRNRPSLEEIIDLLVTEDLADGHPGWSSIVEAGRDRFFKRQLRAAVRAFPEVAIEELKRCGHL